MFPPFIDNSIPFIFVKGRGYVHWCISGKTVLRRISERSAKVEVTGIVAPVSMTKGKVQGTEDRIVTNEDAPGKAELAEVELLLVRLPYVTGLQ
jgi:hypothetical protein